MSLRRLGTILILLGALPFVAAFLGLFLAGELGCIGDVGGQECTLWGIDLNRVLGGMISGFSLAVPGAVALIAGMFLIVVSVIRGKAT